MRISIKMISPWVVSTADKGEMPIKQAKPVSIQLNFTDANSIRLSFPNHSLAYSLIKTKQKNTGMDDGLPLFFTSFH